MVTSMASIRSVLPRVGDRDFGQGLQLTYRFVNNKDIVTKVPPPGKYRHVGCLKQINAGGVIDDDSCAAARGEHVSQMDSFFSKEEMNTFRAIMQKAMRKIPPFLTRQGKFSAGLTNYIPGAILDHVPIRYAKHIKKNILQGKK